MGFWSSVLKKEEILYKVKFEIRKINKDSRWWNKKPSSIVIQNSKSQTFSFVHSICANVTIEKIEEILNDLLETDNKLNDGEYLKVISFYEL